jgi:hypothetical protein
MRDAVLAQLEKGVHASDYEVYIHAVTPGRFREENDMDLYVRNGTAETHLLYVKVFHGRKPWYRPWLELFGISAEVTLNRTTVRYFESALEHTLLATFASALDDGENVFVDYHNDIETKRQLTAGLPAVLTRLGNKLYRLGFTWFKDWYYPEGYMEGEQKLQAEKPLDSDSRNRQLREIRSSVGSFLDSVGGCAQCDPYVEHAVHTAKAFIDTM